VFCSSRDRQPRSEAMKVTPDTVLHLGEQFAFVNSSCQRLLLRALQERQVRLGGKGSRHHSAPRIRHPGDSPWAELRIPLRGTRGSDTNTCANQAASRHYSNNGWDLSDETKRAIHNYLTGKTLQLYYCIQ